MKLSLRKTSFWSLGAATLLTCLSAQGQVMQTSPNDSPSSFDQSGRVGTPTTEMAQPYGPTGATNARSGFDTTNDGYSLLPYTRRGYVGINLGRPEYDNDCGVTGFACNDPNLSGRIYTGGLFNDNFGLELAYLNMGRAERAGGTTRAEGLNLSLIGRMPLGAAFSIFAKGGVTYGRTKVSTDGASGVPAGNDSGWGGSYGGGLSFDLAANSSVVLEWERHDFHFVNEGRQPVTSTTVGYVHRF